jgi:hypothetical protein
MTTKSKNGATEKQKKMWAAAADPSGKIKIANREKGFQQKLEKMQVALVQKDIRYKKTIARGLKELVNARKMEQLLKDNNIRVLSDYTHLKEIYENDLVTITASDLQREADAKAEQFLTGANKISAAQEKVVKELYSLEAKTNQLGIEQVRDFLILKGEIKETHQDKARLHQKEKMAEEVAA